MTNTDDLMYRLKTSGEFTELDIHFAGFISKLARHGGPELALAAALVSNRSQAGHICLDLSAMAGGKLTGNNHDDTIICPDLESWTKALTTSMVVGFPGEYKPLILDSHSRFYLYRYWNYEKILGESIIDRAARDRGDIDNRLLRNSLKRLFQPTDTGETDWQKVAAFTAVIKGICVISGGPGSGKTATVAKILALLLEQDRTLRIALAAPTGKASARLQESIRETKETLDCPEDIKKLITGEASTIHRLLKNVRHTPYFRHNEENPLPADVVVVDEASMVDLALMSKLAQAVAPEARLILLGDKDQLASVEAGAVLGDICGAGKDNCFTARFQELYNEITDETIERQEISNDSLLNDCVVQLHKSYRFDETSGIGAISRAINAGHGEETKSILREKDYEDIKWLELPSPETLARALKDRIIDGYKDCLEAAYPALALDLFGRFRVLGAVREGPYGVAGLNHLIEQILRSARLIKPNAAWYIGRPVMITRNDYNLKLFNGDIGITLPENESGSQLRVWFKSADGALRKIPPVRMPEHETAYAITVHKSQGSEFDRVVLILPDKESPVVTRELIYTGLTRAKTLAEIWCRENVLMDGVSRRIERKSGLADILWQSN